MKHPAIAAIGLMLITLLSGCYCCRPMGHRMQHGFPGGCATGACPPGAMIGPQPVLQPQPMPQPQGSMYAPQGSLSAPIGHGVVHHHGHVPMTASSVPMESLPTY